MPIREEFFFRTDLPIYLLVDGEPYSFRHQTEIIVAPDCCGTQGISEAKHRYSTTTKVIDSHYG
jgi:hypothetical protein